MQMHSSVGSLPSAMTGAFPAPRFMGPLIAGILLALVVSSILISILFQNIFVPTPLLVRGGSVYTIPLVSTVAPWRSSPVGIHVQIVNHR